MEIGIISDIHGNLPALRSVLEDLDKRGVETILCAGDFVGYYSSPNKVISQMRKRDVRAVRGNHDEAVVTGIPQDYRDTAISTLNWTQENLTENSREYLQQLPIERVEKFGPITAQIVHGSPLNPLTEYIYSDDVNHRFVKENLLRKSDFLILGHSHHQFVSKVGKTTVINPGSVGQPRDGENTAGYAVIDTEYRAATPYRVEYDISKTQEGVREKNLPERLARRLEKGK